MVTAEKGNYNICDKDQVNDEVKNNPTKDLSIVNKCKSKWHHYCNVYNKNGHYDIPYYFESAVRVD